MRAAARLTRVALMCGSIGWFLLETLIAHDHRTGGVDAMNGFLTSTFTRQKFRGLLINAVLGNFAGYVAGSLVTLLFTYHSIERRAIWNLFGVLPRKKIVVHLLPQWLEWLLALIVGFLVMELVRYWLNPRKYTGFLSALRQEREPETAVNPSRQSEVADGGAAQEAAPKSGRMNPLEPT